MRADFSFGDLQKIPSLLTNFKDSTFALELNDFLKGKKDDYYFYGHEPYDAKYLEIGIVQLERIIAYVDELDYPRLHASLNITYRYAIAAEMKSVFLYGRARNE